MSTVVYLSIDVKGLWNGFPHSAGHGEENSTNIQKYQLVLYRPHGAEQGLRHGHLPQQWRNVECMYCLKDRQEV